MKEPVTDRKKNMDLYSYIEDYIRTKKNLGFLSKIAKISLE